MEITIEVVMFMIWLVSLMFLFQKRFYVVIVGVLSIVYSSLFLFNNSTVFAVSEFVICSMMFSVVGIGNIIDGLFK